MFTIIVPLDGSHESERAVGLGCMLAEALHGTLELVTVLEEPVLVDLLPSLILPDRQSSEAYLHTVAKRLPTGIPVQTYALRGNPVDAILAYAAERPDTLIAMSTHGRTGMSRIMLGSVADKVARGANCPVALVRGIGIAPTWQSRKILVPLDGSELAESALPLATALSGRQNGELHLLRVVPSFWSAPYVAFAPQAMYLAPDQIADMTARAQGDARLYLETLAMDLRDKDYRVNWEVSIGRPADEIVRVSESVRPDVVVLSTHGRGGFRRWALGSVTDEVLRREGMPVIIIPPPIA